jgi:reductive dehalogenase
MVDFQEGNIMNFIFLNGHWSNRFDEMFLILLLLADAALFLASLYFMVESVKEQEPRAPKVAAWALLLTLLIGACLIWVPALRIPIGLFFLLATLFFLACLIPGKPDLRAVHGAEGHAVGEVLRFDERDVVFARNRSLPPGSEVYRRYYERHPEKEERDAWRREKGGPLGRPGRIDGGHRPNVSMVKACFEMPQFLGQYARSSPAPEDPPLSLDPGEASKTVKGLALHLGADLVGVCRVNHAWAYSHRGEIYNNNWEDWGREITDILPYAVVIATEMDHKLVGAGPHTPCVVASSADYAKGAYITTILARWFSHMGYKGIAEHNRNYDLLMVPLAVDAGLGELGRQGYLIAPKFGARVRLFAVMTDMPLLPDRPTSIGADGFCRHCKKCAKCCPSNSIPSGEKTVFGGTLRWKINEETCFEYWGKVGTDCSICMAVCPFSRPDIFLHRAVRWIVNRSPLARAVFPHVDNFIYGMTWRSRSVSPWVSYPKDPKRADRGGGQVG